MTVVKTKRDMPPKFKEIVERRRDVRNTTEQAIAIVLQETKKPMTVIEITAAVKQLTGRNVDDAWLRKVLYEMVRLGQVTRRVETDDERLLRAGGRRVRGYNAMLYSAGAKVPARVDTTVVDGMPLLDSTGIYGGGRKPGFKIKKKARPAKEIAKPVTDENPGLVEVCKTLTDEIRSLKARVDSLEMTNRMLANALRV